MSLASGTRLGPYEVLAPLGAGGMGEVYRARDLQLERDVAIKVLPDELANDPERLARFEREARVLASLNHSNIATIYGLESSNGIRALVMELVPGETLRGPLAVRTALEYAKQIAEALEAAHERGIVHRDLKPGNIMITPEGGVKVLDFGLAAAPKRDGTASAPGKDAANSPTLTVAATQAGMIMGTAAYMSPEQAAGKTVDKRADIWSFGVVLWEMLSGTRLFAGETVLHTLADVLRAPIGFDKLPRETPRAIRELLRRCLDRDARRRLRDIGEARIAIEESLNRPEKEPETIPAAVPPGRAIMPWALAVVSVAALAALAWVHFRGEPAALPVLNSSLPLPANAQPGSFALSPDGKWLVIQLITENGIQLWLRSLASPDFQRLPGTEFAFSPFWSPDSKSIGFVVRGKLETISVAGGPQHALCEGTGVSGSGGTWNRDGVIVFGSAAGPLRRANASGGRCTAATRAEGTNAQRFPEFLPDGDHFVFAAGGADESSRGIYVASLDDPTPRRLLPDVSGVLFASSMLGKEYGYLLFGRGNSLMAQPFNSKTLQLAGDVFPTGVQASSLDSHGFLELLASVSGNGMLAYRYTPGDSMSQLTWLDRTGRELGTVGASVQNQIHLTLSPDGKTAATYRNQEILLTDLRRAAESNFTQPERSASPPVWSPDGTLIAFGADKGLYVKDARGGLQEELLFKDENVKRPSDWSRDGRYLIYTVESGNEWQIWYLSDPLNRSGNRKAVQLASPEQAESQGQLSPNGRWLAYTAADMGSTTVYVRPFPSGPGRWTISGSETVNVEPRWRDDGKELFYLEGIAPTQTLMAVSVQVGPHGDFQAGPPRKLFEFRGTSHVPSINAFSYNPSADGQRFLVNVEAAENQSAVNVITNWEKAALGNK
jgi:eukaryotic-like serine/threonine-protein kinase